MFFKVFLCNNYAVIGILEGVNFARLTAGFSFCIFATCKFDNCVS